MLPLQRSRPGRRHAPQPIAVPWRWLSTTAMALELLLFASSESVAGASNGMIMRSASSGSLASQMIGLAPAAQIPAPDDINSKGNCTAEVDKHCQGVSAGEGALAGCLGDVIAEADVQAYYGMEAGTEPVEVSDACREEVYQYKISRNANINRNIPLAKACKADADKYCNVTWFFGYRPGQVIACLRTMKPQVAPACAQELFKVQLDAARDFRSDPMLYKACMYDAPRACGNVKRGGGRMQACLCGNRTTNLSWNCDDQLYRQELENADDIRLNIPLHTKCLKDMSTFCSGAEPGGGEAQDCLLEHRKDQGFSPGCAGELAAMIERRVDDFRYDTRLRKACKADVYKKCAYFVDVDGLATTGQGIVHCLQDNVDELESADCQSRVRKYQELAAEDIRFNRRLATGCGYDIGKLCTAAGMQASARVIRCLVDHRDQLSQVCRPALLEEEARFSDNINYQLSIKASCTKELEQFCKDVPHGQARAIRCLQDSKQKRDFGADCAGQLAVYEAEAASDGRLDYRLGESCRADLSSLRAKACPVEEGAVRGGAAALRCLTERAGEIHSQACQMEVTYLQRVVAGAPKGIGNGLSYAGVGM